MSKHTPGPWSFSTLACDAIIASIETTDEHTRKYYGGELIAESVGADNKNVIVAAPDLLAVCEDVLMSLQLSWGHDVPAGLVERIRAAVARANGYVK